ncbi:MAG: hypothetical protein AB1485_09320, partial [Candidatus Thermoplasmatota archaeon]
MHILTAKTIFERHMNYNETLNYLYGLQRFGIKLGLKNIKTLTKLLGEPHKNLRAIHITGT